jgi:hypothetical protein
MQGREGLSDAATPAEACSGPAIASVQMAAPVERVFVRVEVAVVLAVVMVGAVLTLHLKPRMVRGVYPRRRRDMN